MYSFEIFNLLVFVFVVLKWIWLVYSTLSDYHNVLRGFVKYKQLNDSMDIL